MNGASYSICRVVILGRVQGVGYRAWTEHTALRRGVEGWVRNRRDGSVEAVFAGPADIVEAMVDACHKGPPGAHVDRLDRHAGGDDDLASRRPGDLFSVLPTG